MKKQRNKENHPERTCVSCRNRFAKKDLLRHVWDGARPVADPVQVMPGRGVYCCRNEECTKKFFSAGKKWKSMFRV